MRFISLYTPKATTGAPSPELIAAMGKLIEDGMKSGWLIATEGVQSGTIGTRVRKADGKITVVDGPFAEAKEVIGGYALLNVKSREAAIELARRFLDVAGDGTCEVHQLFEEVGHGPPPR